LSDFGTSNISPRDIGAIISDMFNTVQFKT